MHWGNTQPAVIGIVIEKPTRNAIMKSKRNRRASLICSLVLSLYVEYKLLWIKWLTLNANTWIKGHFRPLKQFNFFTQPLLFTRLLTFKDQKDKMQEGQNI